MSSVHASKGLLGRPATQLRSEVAIVCSLAEATCPVTGSVIPWAEFRADYTEIRHAISRVVPGCAAYAEKVDRPGGFFLPHPPRDSRTFPTEAGRAIFTVSPSRCCTCRRAASCSRRCAATTSSTPRSTVSTTATAASPTAAGWSSCIPTTSPRSACADGQIVDLISEWTDGTERTAPEFRVVSYDTPRGLRRVLLPGDQPTRAPRLDGAGQQLPDLQVGDRPVASRCRTRSAVGGLR